MFVMVSLHIYVKPGSFLGVLGCFGCVGLRMWGLMGKELFCKML